MILSLCLLEYKEEGLNFTPLLFSVLGKYDAPPPHASVNNKTSKAVKTLLVKAIPMLIPLKNL